MRYLRRQQDGHVIGRAVSRVFDGDLLRMLLCMGQKVTDAFKAAACVDLKDHGHNGNAAQRREVFGLERRLRLQFGRVGMRVRLCGA